MSSSISSWVSATVRSTCSLPLRRFAVLTGEAARAFRFGAFVASPASRSASKLVALVNEWFDRSSLLFSLRKLSHSIWSRPHCSFQNATRSR